jgi:PadR family transcriptional regulator
MAKNDQLLGALDLLVLKTLSQLGSMHGYGIASHIQRVSDELLRVEEGSLYPALHRIEEAGWIASEWRATENNRRAKFYKLTPQGRKQLAKEEQSWERVVQGIGNLLKFADS